MSTYRAERTPITDAEVQKNPSMPTPNLPNMPPKEIFEQFLPPETQAVATTATQSPSQFAPPMPGVNRDTRVEELAGLLNTNYNYGRVQLPSLGKFYNGSDGPSDGFVEVRKMLGLEEQILADQGHMKKGVAIDMIFDSCMKGGYRSENFLTADRAYLLIYLRGISFSSNYDIEVVCPGTNKKFSYTVNLNLDVNNCPDDFGVDKLFGVLPDSGFNFKYRLSTGRDDLALIKHKETKAKQRQNALDDTILFRTASLITELGKGDIKVTDFNQILTLIKKLTVGDLSYLRNTINDPPFGVETLIPIVSPYTGEEFDIELPIDASFFSPKLPKK